LAPRVVRDRAELRALLGSRELYAKRPLALELPGLSAQEAFAWSERLNGLRNECGCSLGAKCMAAGFLAALAALAVLHGPFTPALLLRLPLAAVAAVVCAGLGKAAGILMARRRLRREIASLASNVPDPTEED